MTFLIHSLRISKQLMVLLIWVSFVGWTMWQHTQQSQQPPIYDAFSYYQKAYNFWTAIYQHKLSNPFNIEPTFRPPGTILMSYPFGFDNDYRSFYFRSIFLPIALFSLAAVISSYRRELDSKSKWLLVLFTVFISSLPCFYNFEVTTELPAAGHWGIVDNFLAGIAAFATAAMVRSVWSRSFVWLVLAAVFASFCILIKPTGMLIMMLIGFTWFCLTALELKLVWQSPDERKNTLRWLLRGMGIFAIPYLIVLACSFTSHYLSAHNLAYGNAAIVIMQTELLPSWDVLRGTVYLGIGYPFVAWLFLMIILVGNYLWHMPTDSRPYPKTLLVGLAFASCTTLIFGIWFWIFGSGGTTQIRYFIPFVLVTAIFALPIILTAVRAMPDWKIAVLSVLMIAPVINIGMLLPQHNAPIEWQKWSGVNLTSGASDIVMVQAQNFVAELKRKSGNNVVLYSISPNTTDAYFSAAIEYAGITMPPIPINSMVRPIDWQRPSTYRKKEMLGTDYWLFKPVRNSNIAQAILNTPSIDTFEQETALFQAWATQLTPNEGVTIFSETPITRVLHISDFNLLEQAFDALIAKHHWRDIFVTANPKNQFTEKEVVTALAQNPPNLENVNFSGRFHLRALSVSRTGDNVTVRFWWKPLSPIPENDWALFIHSIDSEGKIVLANGSPVRFNRALSSLTDRFLFDQITFSNPIGNKTHRLALGFVRPNQTALVADSGTRDWNNQRVIVPLP